jgi:hypothetical protein
MAILNASLGWVIDLLLAPFSRLPPIAGLSAVSLLTATAMLLVYRATSDQRRLAEVKRAIAAALYEIRLFNDDLTGLFRAQGEMLRQNARYLRLSLVPMLWMIAPIGLVAAHLEGHYASAGLTPGQPVLVKVAVAGSGEPLAAELDAPHGVRVLTPAVWLPAANEVIWRVALDAPGEFVVTARVAGGTFTKTLDATSRVTRRSPVRTTPTLLNQLMYPAERPLPADAAVTSISVRYPSRSIRLVRWDVPWLVVYAGLSIVFALALKKPLGVTL